MVKMDNEVNVVNVVNEDMYQSLISKLNDLDYMESNVNEIIDKRVKHAISEIIDILNIDKLSMIEDENMFYCLGDLFLTAYNAGLKEMYKANQSINK